MDPKPGAMTSEGSKKSPFDDLNKEELVTKCKGLLAIAQRAKLAKTDLQNEVESYKLQIEKYETEKKQNFDKLKTLQELVDSLTEQKLNIITEVDSAQGKVKSLSAQCKSYEDEIKKFKAELIVKDEHINEITQKLSTIDCEVISLKRQNTRLTEENEQLLNQLTEIEASTAEVNNIGLQQMEQLKILEQTVHKDDEVYKKEIKTLNSQIDELQNKLKLMEEENTKLVEAHQSKFNETYQLYEAERAKKDKAYIKLRSYKDKILKCATCINQLKNSRHILTKTVKEYSENIPKWQNDILRASKVLEEQMTGLDNENKLLKEQISELEMQLQNNKHLENPTQIEILSEQVKQLNTEKESLITQLQNMNQQYDDTAHLNKKLQQDIEEITIKYKSINTTVLPEQTQKNKDLESQILDYDKNIKKLEENINYLNRTIEKLNVENQQLVNMKNNDQFNEVINNLNLQIKSLESEKAILVKEKLIARDTVIELENSNKILTSQVNKMTNEIHELKSQFNAAVKENSILIQKSEDGEMNILKSKLKEQQEQFDLLKKEYDDIQDLNNLLKEEVETLKLSLEQPKDDSENLSDLNVSLQADIVKLETKLAAYKQENASLLAEVKESRNKIKEFDALITEYDEAKSKLISYKTENSELLNEMKEINQVLKERGESISKQQKAIAEMERLIETLEKDRDELIEDKKDLIKKVASLENDLKNAEIKTNENSGIFDDIVSERDILKQQLKEKEELIESLKEELEKAKQQQSAPSDLPNEDMSTSTISKAEDYSRMKDLDETFEEKYTKLRIFALKLKKKLNETTTLLNNTEQDKAKLEKMLENMAAEHSKTTQHSNVEDKTSDNVQNEITQLQDKVNTLSTVAEKTEIISAELDKVKAELNLKCQELAAEVEAHKVTKENLEKARRDAKKKNVLSLEIEDYERSMKELTLKIEENKKKMVQMESTIDTQEGTITAMKTQIKLLEEQIKTEETQNRLIKEELQLVIEENKNKDSVIHAKNDIISKLEQDLEDEKRKNEEADLEMTTVMSEKEKIIMSLGDDKAELNNKVKRLEFKCGELNEKLKIVNMELADLKTEYTSYKVRAQAVLRQNQTVDKSQEEQLKEEAAALRAQIENLTSKLTAVKEQCSEQTTEAENARRRASEAASEVARAQQRTTRLHADLARLSQQLDSERVQHKLQVTTLTQCYKTQISELELKLQKETDNLKKQLAAALEANKSKDNAGVLDSVNQNQYMVPVIPKDEGSDGEMDINVSMIPREEGEGSEWAPSPPPSKAVGASGRSPVPLERLLEEGVPEDGPPDAALPLTHEQELLDLRRTLQAQQQRVKHVTVLLSESERECARLTQLSDLLKAELRRVRGSSPTAHNAQYMKNVTLKFLTLPPGDERSRLVPVLQKLLTLTQEETQKIQAIAKGLDPNPGKGWGSYLPWPK